MLNRITIMGRLVANPELRYTPKGTPVCSIRIACDRETKNADGEYDTDFIDVVAWRSVAENIARRFAKGRMAVIDGRLQIRPWDGPGRHPPLRHGNPGQPRLLWRQLSRRRGRE